MTYVRIQSDTITKGKLDSLIGMQRAKYLNYSSVSQLYYRRNADSEGVLTSAICAVINEAFTSQFLCPIRRITSHHDSYPEKSFCIQPQLGFHANLFRHRDL